MEKTWSETSFILRPSSIGGIGVFATHDIPAGTLLCRTSHNKRTLKIKDVPFEFLKYCVYINDEECICPERFDRMEIGWFINHSATPNIASNTSTTMTSNGPIRAYSFYALTDIKAGNEIVIDYNSFNEPENLKEEYYKQS